VNTDFFDIQYPKMHYKLWWRFLRRSKDYKEFCLWMRNRLENPSLKCPEKFLIDGKKGRPKPIIITFMRNNDIHAFSFQEWYEYKTEERVVTSKANKNQVLQNYNGHVCRLLEDRIKVLNDVLQREPTATELMEYIKDEPRFFQNRLYVFTPHNVSPQKTMKIIKDKLDGLGYRKPPIRYDAISKHIKAYDMQKCGKSRREIAPKIYPGEQSNAADTLTQVFERKGETL